MTPDVIRHDNVIGSLLVKVEGLFDLMRQDYDDAVRINFFDFIDEHQISLEVFDGANNHFGFAEVDFFKGFQIADVAVETVNILAG